MTQLWSLVHRGQGKEMPSSLKQVLLQWQSAIKIPAGDSEIPGIHREK